MILNHFEYQLDFLKKVVKKVQMFLIIFWMLNLIIAYQDKSQIMTQQFSTISMTFKTWNIADASISLLILPFLIIFNAQSEKYENNSQYYQSWQNNCMALVCGVLMILKFVWILVGLSFFAKFQFLETSRMLMQFSIVYFVGSMGGYIYLTYLSICRVLLVDVIEQYERKIDFKNIIDVYKRYKLVKYKNKLNLQKVTSKKSLFLDFCKDQNMVSSFNMILNFILYDKDKSECMDYVQTGYPFTFRKWHLIQGIFSVITTITSMFLIGIVARYFLGLEIQKKISVWIILTCAIAMTVVINVWMIIGIFLFLRIPNNTCSDQAYQVSFTYFMYILTTYTIIVFELIKNLVKSCI